MRSELQQKIWDEMWDSLVRVEPERESHYLYFDFYEVEVEEKYGTLELDDDTCREVVKRITDIDPIFARYDKEMNGIEYQYEEEE